MAQRVFRWMTKQLHRLFCCGALKRRGTPTELPPASHMDEQVASNEDRETSTVNLKGILKPRITAPEPEQIENNPEKKNICFLDVKTVLEFDKEENVEYLWIESTYLAKVDGLDPNDPQVILYADLVKDNVPLQDDEEMTENPSENEESEAAILTHDNGIETEEDMDEFIKGLVEDNLDDSLPNDGERNERLSESKEGRPTSPTRYDLIDSEEAMEDYIESLERADSEASVGGEDDDMIIESRLDNEEREETLPLHDDKIKSEEAMDDYIESLVEKETELSKVGGEKYFVDDEHEGETNIEDGGERSYDELFMEVVDKKPIVGEKYSEKETTVNVAEEEGDLMEKVNEKTDTFEEDKGSDELLENTDERKNTVEGKGGNSDEFVESVEEKKNTVEVGGEKNSDELFEKIDERRNTSDGKEGNSDELEKAEEIHFTGEVEGEKDSYELAGNIDGRKNTVEEEGGYSDELENVEEQKNTDEVVREKDVDKALENVGEKKNTVDKEREINVEDLLEGKGSALECDEVNFCDDTSERRDEGKFGEILDLEESKDDEVEVFKGVDAEKDLKEETEVMKTPFHDLKWVESED